MNGIGIGMGKVGRKHYPANALGKAVAALVALTADSSRSAVFNPFDRRTLFQDAEGTTGAGLGDPVRLMLDVSGNGNDALGPDFAAGARPLASDEGLTFDGTEDRSKIDFADGSGSTNMTVIAIVKTGVTKAVMFSGDAQFFGCIEDGSATAHNTGVGTPAVLVDGAAIGASRDAMHTAVGDGNPHLCEFASLNLSSLASLWFGTFKPSPAGWYVSGALFPIAVLDNATLADPAAARSAALALGDIMLARFA